MATLRELWNPDIQQLQPYQPGKPIEALTRELGLTDIIKLASNENPRGPGPAVREALAKAVTELNRYPDGSGFRLKAALAAHLDVEPGHVTLGNGSNDVLELIAKVVLTPGAEVVVSAHAFVVYGLATIAAGGRLVEVPAQNYGADLDAMLAAITPKTRLVFLANPNNPTGTWVGGDALRAFLAAVPPEVLVVLDEAYFEYMDDPDYPDGLALMRSFKNLAVTRTFSKIYGLAGLRVGYAVTGPVLADLLNRVRQPFNVNSLGLVAAEVALAEQNYVAESRRLNSAGLAQLEAGLAQAGLSWIPTGCNFLCVDMGRDAGPLYEALLRRGVIVRPVAGYGMPQHLRISVGTEAENARCLQALQALGDA